MAKNYEVALLLDFYGEMLTEKQREVIDLYYNEDLSLAEIGQEYQITRQGVRDSIKRGEAILFEMEEKLGFAARHKAMIDAFQYIRQQALHIDSYNDQFCFAKEISEAAANIKDTINALAELS